MVTLARISRYTAYLAAIGGLTMATPCASFDQRDHETYRCNTPYGHIDGAVFPSTNDFGTLYGKISFHMADIGPEWASMGKIVFHQRGAHYSDGDCSCDGVAVYAFKNPDHVEFNLTSNGKDVPIAQSPYEKPISFKVTITPQGLMTVAIGKTNAIIKTVKLRHREHNTFEMSCSGADVSFFDITNM
jgi:hypothetical protein